MVFNNNLLMGGVAAASGGGGGSGYTVANSLWVEYSDSPEIIMPNADSGGLLWIFSCWVKRAGLDTSNRNTIVSVHDSSGYGTSIEFSNSAESKEDQLVWIDGNTTGSKRATTQKFTDASGWYHLCFRYDSANFVADNRMIIWVNGVRVGDWNTGFYTNPTASLKSFWGGGTENVDMFNQNNDRYFDGYISQAAWIYGQDYQASNFGEYDSNGVWIPKDLSTLTFTGSTKSFLLAFEDSSDLDKDTSGLSNNGTSTTGITTANQTVDTPSQ